MSRGERLAQDVARAAADVLAAAVAGRRELVLALPTEDPDWPCSFLGRHRDLEVLVDREASAAL